MIIDEEGVGAAAPFADVVGNGVVFNVGDGQKLSYNIGNQNRKYTDEQNFTRRKELQREVYSLTEKVKCRDKQLSKNLEKIEKLKEQLKNKQQLLDQKYVKLAEEAYPPLQRALDEQYPDEHSMKRRTIEAVYGRMYEHYEAQERPKKKGIRKEKIGKMIEETCFALNECHRIMLSDEECSTKMKEQHSREYKKLESLMRDLSTWRLFIEADSKLTVNYRGMHGLAQLERGPRIKSQKPFFKVFHFFFFFG
jgi:hypothetical protein